VTKSSKAERGRFYSRNKAEAVLRLPRGEELDALSRELGVTAATLSSWREAFLAAGQASLKSRGTSAEQDELRRLKEPWSTRSCATRCCAKGCDCTRSATL